MKYIAEKKIKSTKHSKETTPSKAPIIEVKYEDGTTDYFTKMMYDILISDTPYDVTDFRNKKIFAVVESLLVLLREWNVSPEDINKIVDVLVESVQRNANQALTNLVKDKFPQVKSFNELGFLEIDTILKDAGNKA